MRDDRIKCETYNGNDVLKLDFSNLNGFDFLEAMEKSHEIIASKGSENLIVMTDIHNVILDRKTTKLFKAISHQNKQYIGMSLFFPVNTIQKMTCLLYTSPSPRD